MQKSDSVVQIDPAFALELNGGFESGRLLFEPIGARHAEPLFELMQDAAIYQWISSHPPRSVEILRKSWAQRETRVSPDGTLAWLNWAARRKDNGAYVGRLDAEVNHERVTTMVATVTFGNSASCRVLEKSGFVRTRILPDNDTIRGVKYDDIEYVWSV